MFMSKFAVIRLGGRQFKVSEGFTFELEKQSSLTNEVLLVSDGDDVKIGTPVLKNYEVTLSLIEEKRDKKIRVVRFKSKSRYRKVKGHRQPVSVVKVEKIEKKGTKK